MNPKNFIDIRLRHLCLNCDKWGRPLKRVWGYPTDVKASIEGEKQGRFRLMGCTIGVDQAGYECRHCGADWRIIRF